MTEGLLEERGVAYRASDIKPERQTLLFVHGLSGSSSAWFPYEQEFENTYNIVSLDLRGHGKSKKWSAQEEYALSKFSDDIAALLKHLHIEHCVLVSHSFGTLMALQFIFDYPHRVETAIFLSPVFGVHRRISSKIVLLGSTILATILAFLPFPSKVGDRVDYSHYQNSGDWNLRRIIADVGNTTLRVYIYCLKEIWRHNFDTKWKDISIPTLLIHGKHDTIVPYQNAVQLSKEIQHSKLILLPAANHILVFINVSEVSAAIKNFIK